MRFCEWYIQKCENEFEFSNLVIQSDKTQFTNYGVFNKHNHHYWSIENPRLLEQRRFGFNVWCGILGRHLVGPFIFNQTLNGERYLDLLRGQVIPAVRHVVPNDIRFRDLWFQQDSCPAHNTVVVRMFLSEHFQNNIISNQGAVARPARSPDLTPLDFY